MDEKILNFNENQLKRTGFGEAFTPDLKAQMERGIPEIQHTVQKEYEGDKVEATLYLKKSKLSDYYILKKFDLHLQKDGLANTVKQTFYLAQNNFGTYQIGSQHRRHDNKFTLKEAYNLLAGRAVFKNLVNKEGQEYQAWVKLNFKNVLDNGNHEMKHYHTNYGFDLEKVLANYAIKELLNIQFKQNLMESLQRGNLQKATFVDRNGKEEKLYVSTNVTLGSLNVYDLNKQRLPTDALVNRQYMGTELSQKISQYISQREKAVNGFIKQLDESSNLEQKKTLILKEKNSPKIKQTRKLKVK